MNYLIKAISLMLLTILMTGCSHPFKKPGDELIKSPCEACQKAPFYINGKWVKP